MKKPSIALVCLLMCLCTLANWSGVSATQMIAYGPVAVVVTASSTLLGKWSQYPPENVLDEDPTTAWLEGQDGTAGDSLTFQFSQPVEFCGFEYIPGYAKSRQLYQANAVPSVFTISSGASTVVTHTYLKRQDAVNVDVSDPQIFSPQFVLVRPTVTRKVTVKVDKSTIEREANNGFSELRPIIRHGGRVYCGNKALPMPWGMLAGGVEKAGFLRTVTIPAEGAVPMNPYPWASMERRISRATRTASGSQLTPKQKALFFPYDESFRLFPTQGGIDLVSARLSFFKGSTPHGYVLRRVSMGVVEGKWVFKKVSFEEDIWN